MQSSRQVLQVWDPFSHNSLPAQFSVAGCFTNTNTQMMCALFSHQQGGWASHWFQMLPSEVESSIVLWFNWSSSVFPCTIPSVPWTWKEKKAERMGKNPVSMTLWGVSGWPCGHRVFLEGGGAVWHLWVVPDLGSHPSLNDGYAHWHRSLGVPSFRWEIIHSSTAKNKFQFSL
jgi:hypothetical protein